MTRPGGRPVSPGAPGRGLLAAVIALGLAGSAASRAQVQAEPTAAPLYAATWEGGYGGDRFAGAACWLRGEASGLRLDVARVPGATAPDPLPWARLLGRAGEGYTLAAGEAGAVAGRWGEPLEVPTEALLMRLETLLALVEAGPEGVPAVLPAGLEALRAGGPGKRAWRVPLPETGSLRERLEPRGRGRGGAGELWRADWQPPAPGAGPCLVLRSSRLPGALRVWPSRPVPVTFLPEDVAVPLWGIGEMLGFPGGRPDGAGPGGG